MAIDGFASEKQSVHRFNTSEDSEQFFAAEECLSKLRIILKNEKKRNIYIGRFQGYGWRWRGDDV